MATPGLILGICMLSPKSGVHSREQGEWTQEDSCGSQPRGGIRAAEQPAQGTLPLTGTPGIQGQWEGAWL